MKIRTSGRLILASASPRRIELLRFIGLDFEIMPGEIDETPLPGEEPLEYVKRLSRQKVRDASDRHPDAWVLGADTIVVINGKMLGKPRTASEAEEMLKKLSGREHFVHTGFAIARKTDDLLIGDVATSSVLFKTIADDEINWYVQTKEPYDKAGGYALQGAGAFFISEIHGSYTNVIGLPLSEAVELLKHTGAIEF
jgi:septum formation protein